MATLTFLTILITLLLNAVYFMIYLSNGPYLDCRRRLKWHFSWLHFFLFAITIAAIMAYGWEATNCHSYSNSFFYKY